MSDTVTIPVAQARKCNRLIDLCQELFAQTDDADRMETLHCIKSLVVGKHITETGLYWNGSYLRP